MTAPTQAHPGATGPAPRPLARMDATSPDAPGCAAFLLEVFGWETGLVLPDGQHVLVHDDEVVAAVVPQPAELRSIDAPGSWTLSFGVPSLSAATAAVEDTGGRVAVPPFEVPGAAMTVVVDRLGGVAALVESRSTRLTFRPPAWAERTTADPDAVLVWANAVLDWSARPVPGEAVHEWSAPDGTVVAALVAGGPDDPERWVPFVAVPDPTGLVDRVERLGGAVLPGACHRGILVRDPWGAVLGVVARP